MTQAASTMKELKATLWKAADKLRGSLSASQYKDVILGLVFLKYVSDAADEQSDGIFTVPPVARWKFLADNAKADIGQLVDREAAPVAARLQPTAALAPELEEERLGTPPLEAHDVGAHLSTVILVYGDDLSSMADGLDDNFEVRHRDAFSFRNTALRRLVSARKGGSTSAGMVHT